MINPISQLIQIKQLFLDRALITSYKKIAGPPKIKAGYVDIGTVLKRYTNSGINRDAEDLLQERSIHDNFFFLEQECSEIIKTLPAKPKVLDIGCGNGLYAKVFKRSDSPFKNPQYFGSEIDERLVNLCQELNPENQFFVSLANHIKAIDSIYDLVFCSSTLHYTLGQWKKSIQEMARVSKRLLAITRFPVTKYHNTFYVQQTVKGINGKETHYFVVINRAELESEFRKNKLEIVKRDYAQEEYRVEGVDEKILLIQYLLRKTL